MLKSCFSSIAAMLVWVCLSSNVDAVDYSDTIYRSSTTNLSKTMSSGDRWYVYYNPDGSYPKLTVVLPPGLYLASSPKPVTQVTVYIRGPGIGWQYLGQTHVTPWTSAIGPLYGVKGTQYLFLITNWQNATPVYVQVK